MELEDDPPPFDVVQWLSGPDREDFPWDVRVSAPFLTLQQRSAVEIRAFFDGGILRERPVPHDLHFVVKVATGDNHWVPGCSHTRVPFPPQVGRFHAIEFADNVYLRPGLYTIALIAYDPILNKGNIWRRQVKVDALKKDKLPELDRNLRNIDFTSKDHPMAEGREWLPVNNKRSLCIDIVANTSMDWYLNPGLGRYWTAPHYSRAARIREPSVKLTDVLQVASVLSHLGLQKGRVRVSIVDVLRVKTYLNREDAAVLDWQRANRIIEAGNPPTVDKDALASQTQASAYLVDKLSEILEDDACAPGMEHPLKIVIVVSTDMVFAKHTPIRQIVPQGPASVLFFHYRIPKGIPADDDLGKMLKPANPRTVTVRDGLSFRKDLADLISHLERIGGRTDAK